MFTLHNAIKYHVLTAMVSDEALTITYVTFLFQDLKRVSDSM